MLIMRRGSEGLHTHMSFSLLWMVLSQYHVESPLGILCSSILWVGLQRSLQYVNMVLQCCCQHVWHSVWHQPAADGVIMSNNGIYGYGRGLLADGLAKPCAAAMWLGVVCMSRLSNKHISAW